MTLTGVSRKGQITLHEHVRTKLDIEPGDVLEEQVQGDKIILTPSQLPSESMREIGKKTKKRMRVDSTQLIHLMRTEDQEET